MRRTPDAIDELVEDVVVDAYGEDEQLGAFVTVIGDHLPLRTGGTVSGHPAVLLDIEAEGSPGHPLVTYRREGETLRASLLDVQAPPGTELARLIAAYRRWAGQETTMPSLTTARRAKRAKKKGWSYPLRTEPAGNRAAQLVQRLQKNPLRLQYLGVWEPTDEYWGEPEDEIETLAGRSGRRLEMGLVASKLFPQVAGGSTSKERLE